jgi:hypothetical protein
MPGTIPVSGELTMENLAATLTRREQLDLEQVTKLVIDTTQPRNLVTTVSQPNQLGSINICAAGGTNDGTKMFSTTAYICGAQKKIDLYRLPL